MVEALTGSGGWVCYTTAEMESLRTLKRRPVCGSKQIEARLTVP